jgi:organic radical activating enzyme
MTKKIKNANLNKGDNNFVLYNDENRKKVKDLLDSKGCGFCLAKWTQVTMHLGAGITHSCHHVKAHKIPLEELKTNPSALHNTEFKKSVRKEMLNGLRPEECDYCWRIEDNTGEFSDRVLKSLDSYSINDYDTIVNLTGNENYYPRYVEVSFSNVCNFKCSYCGPTFSSKWVEEINRYGDYKLMHGAKYNYIKSEETNIKTSEDNPYTDAFWKWFPDAIKHMHTFRITGGEPLLSKHTFKVIEYLLNNPQPNLEFAINTNACPPDKIWDKFVKLIKRMEDDKCVKKILVYVSAESTGLQAEYSRFGMNWNAFTKNVEDLLDKTENVFISFMSAFNILSLPTFYSFLEYILYLKQKNKNETQLERLKKIFYFKKENNKSCNRIFLDIPYVRNPDFLDVKIIDQELLEKYFIPCFNFMNQNQDDNNGFNENEILKFRRIYLDCVYQINEINNDNESLIYRRNLARKRLVNFLEEYDRRRFLKFNEVFPELVDFIKICKEQKNV